MPYADPEKRKLYISEWKKQSRRKRGLQKQGRKPLNPEEKALSIERRKLWEKKWSKEYREYNTSKKLLWAAKQRAKNKGIEFSITEEDINIPELCPYLGIKLQIFNRDRGTCRDAWPTLDRIDNSRGYVRGNIEVISFKANTMKNNATPEELILFSKRVLGL